MGDPSSWSCEQVAAELGKIGLGKFGPKFVEAGISGELLSELKDEHFREMGLPVGPRVQLQKWIKSLSEGAGRAAPAPARKQAPAYDEDDVPPQRAAPARAAPAARAQAAPARGVAQTVKKNSFVTSELLRSSSLTLSSPTGLSQKVGNFGLKKFPNLSPYIPNISDFYCWTLN
jgi:hypothetical protein